MAGSPNRSATAREAEFAELLSHHQHQLVGFIFALVQNMADAEDIYQQTSLVLWKNFDVFEPGTSFRHWAQQTARYVALDHQRQKGRAQFVMSPEVIQDLLDSQTLIPDENAESRRDALANCVKKLARIDADLLEQHYVGRESVKQLAEKTARSSQSICNSLRRIRRFLFECIDRTLAVRER